MIKKLKLFFKKYMMGSDTSYQQNLNNYIISKCPQSSAEVDFWIQRYERDKRYY